MFSSTCIFWAGTHVLHGLSILNEDTGPVGDPTGPVGDPTGPVGDPTGPAGNPNPVTRVSDMSGGRVDLIL